MEAVMTKPLFGKLRRLALWLSPAVLLVAALLVAMPWVKEQSPQVAKGLAQAVVMLLACYGVFVVLRQQRRLDEVQIASQGFANSYGWLFGGVATTVLVMMPPVMNWLVDLVDAMAKGRAGGSPDMTDHLAVRLAFFYAISLVMLVQGLGVCIASVLWWRRMGGTAENS